MKKELLVIGVLIAVLLSACAVVDIAPLPAAQPEQLAEPAAPAEPEEAPAANEASPGTAVEDSAPVVEDSAVEDEPVAEEAPVAETESDTNESVEAAENADADSIAGEERFSTLTAALEATGLISAVESAEAVTIIGPTNEAFAALAEARDVSVDDLLADPGALENLLRYHMVQGEQSIDDLLSATLHRTAAEGQFLQVYEYNDTVYVNGEPLLGDGVPLANGVLYPVDTVLQPPQFEATVDDGITITAQTAAHDDLSTAFMMLLGSGNMATLLDGEGPFTLLMPSDQALRAAGIDEQMLVADSDLTARLVRHHVTYGGLRAADLAEQDHLATLDGTVVPVSVEGEAVIIGNATVVQANIEASNGVIHIIDTILAPEEFEELAQAAP